MKSGRTPLYYAAMYGRVENVRLMLEAKANPEAKDHVRFVLVGELKL